MRAFRVATALYLALALPALVFGFLLKVAPLAPPCVIDGVIGLVNVFGPNGGEPCRAVDFTVLYWLVPALMISVIAIGVAAARGSRVG